MSTDTERIENLEAALAEAESILHDVCRQSEISERLFGEIVAFFESHRRGWWTVPGIAALCRVRAAKAIESRNMAIGLLREVFFPDLTQPTRYYDDLDRRVREYLDTDPEAD